VLEQKILADKLFEESQKCRNVCYRQPLIHGDDKTGCQGKKK
jgi:hypothetical protein